MKLNRSSFVIILFTTFISANSVAFALNCPDGIQKAGEKKSPKKRPVTIMELQATIGRLMDEKESLVSANELELEDFDAAFRPSVERRRAVQRMRSVVYSRQSNADNRVGQNAQRIAEIDARIQKLETQIETIRQSRARK